MADFLKDNLRPASFRGVAFQIESTDLETGRRIQVNEYPQRDKPYCADMGKATRNLKFEAFVIGPDYINQAENLLAALEQRGSGTLVHPWFGSLKVNATSCTVAFDKGLGYARFSLNFVESGELAFPAAAQATQAVSRAAASALEAQSVFSFANVFKVVGFVNNVTDQALSMYGTVLNVLGNPAFALASLTGYGSLLGNLNSLAALFGNPLSLGWNFAGLLNLSGKAKGSGLTGSNAVAVPIVRGLTRMATDPRLAAPTKPTFTTNTSNQIYNNHNAIKANTRQLLIVQAVGLSSFLTADVYDDTLALKNELAAAIDAETLSIDDDDLYQALMAARKAMWHDLTERSRNSARLVTLTPVDVLPALAIAYDYYENAARDLEIVARNKISNPGFVPVKPLRLLSV